MKAKQICDKLKYVLTHKKSACILTLAGLVLGSTAAVYAATQGLQVAQSTPNDTFKESVATKGDLTSGTSEQGTVALNTQNITCSADGSTITEINVSTGQRVKTDDILLKLDTSAIEDKKAQLELALSKAKTTLAEHLAQKSSALAKATAEYEQNAVLGDSSATDRSLALTKLQNDINAAENAYNEAKSAAESAPTNIENAKTSLNTVEASLATAKLNAESADAAATAAVGTENEQKLKEAAETAKKLVTDSEKALSEAKTALENANTSAANAPQKLSEAQQKLAQAQHTQSTGTQSADAALAQANATSQSAKSIYDAAVATVNNNIIEAQASVDSAEKSLAYYLEKTGSGILTAPANGIIKTINYAVGDTLNTQQPAIVIAKTDIYSLAASVAQEDVTQLTVGMEVNVVLDAFEGKSFGGKISSIAATPSREGSSTVSYAVTVDLDNVTDSLLDGMTGTITFVTKQLKDVLYVSNKAITQNGAVQTVTVKNADGSTKLVNVETGFSDGHNVEIKSGLSEGDIVLISIAPQEVNLK